MRVFLIENLWPGELENLFYQGIVFVIMSHERKFPFLIAIIKLKTFY